MSLATPGTKIVKKLKLSTANMLKDNEYKNYQDFIRRHYIDKDDKSTHITNTRIGNPGGKYHIPDDEYNIFLELYYRDIVSRGADEYLTEKQLVEGGPIAIDVDLRYPYEITEKQYKKPHIDDLVYLYLGIFHLIILEDYLYHNYSLINFQNILVLNNQCFHYQNYLYLCYLLYYLN